MKVRYEHFYGSEEQFDLQLTKPILELGASREVEAVEQGWAINDDKWYNCRSTRLRLEYYTKTQRIPNYTFTHYQTLTAEQLQQIEQVYQLFIELKGFNRIYNLSPNNPRTSWLVAASDKIHAFTMFTEYDGALESNLTAWDYSEPKRSIGKHIIGYEAEIAKQKGFEHLYIGPGYNSSAIYKGYLKGFEWWTGSEWSCDVDKYVSLCQRDDTISTIEQLSDLYVSS